MQSSIWWCIYCKNPTSIILIDYNNRGHLDQTCVYTWHYIHSTYEEGRYKYQHLNWTRFVFSRNSHIYLKIKSYVLFKNLPLRHFLKYTNKINHYATLSNYILISYISKLSSDVLVCFMCVQYDSQQIQFHLHKPLNIYTKCLSFWVCFCFKCKNCLTV